MKPKDKGDMALAYAIKHYLLAGYEVCLPIGDRRDFDLVIEKRGKLERVQVKYGGFYPAKGKCFVGLRITGGNQSFHYSKKYSDNAFDHLFVYTARGHSYSIPWKEVKARSELSIENIKYNKYLIDTLG